MQAATSVVNKIQFSITRDALLLALQRVSGVVERRQTLPILGNVLLQASSNELRITGTDLEVELTATAELVSCEHAGSITVPARKLVDICRSLPEAAMVVLTLEKQNLLLKSGGSRFTLACLPAAEFPHAPALQEAVKFSLTSDALSQLFAHSHFAMAQQDVRYFLNGSLFHLEGQHIKVVATDGHRLAMTSRKIVVDNSVDKKVIIPRKAVLELIRLLNTGAEMLDISFDNNHICFKGHDFVMLSKLVDGRFPDYNRVIPRHNDKTLVIDRDLLKQSLSRVAILANEKHRGVRLDLKPGNLILSANNPEREQAEESIVVDYQFEAVNIGFNVSYLLDILSVLPAGNTEWLFSNGSGSVLVENNQADQENLYVIMPMRL